MAIGRQLSDDNSSGTSLGQSATDTISFYGFTPIAQRAGAAQGTFTTTMTSTTAFGFGTQTAADAAIALLAEIRATLVALGLIKGSA